MAVVDFLRRNHRVTAVFFDHGTQTSHDARQFLEQYVQGKDVDLVVGEIDQVKQKNQSQEEFWRIERYKYFYSFTDAPVITCHHLDDCVETWIWSCFHGEGKIIPYRNSNVIRPFRLNSKHDFIHWCQTKNVPWIEDKSNVDLRYIRNYIRHELLPRALVVNSGLHKVIMKKVKQDEETFESYSRDVSPGYGIVC